jgi:flagellar biosynthesis/type III secretory pathway M-ring protein FliF/YscJ
VSDQTLGMNMTAKKIAVLVVILAALAGIVSFVVWSSNREFSLRI